jgi:hypothetical protein
MDDATRDRVEPGELETALEDLFTGAWRDAARFDAGGSWSDDGLAVALTDGVVDDLAGDLVAVRSAGAVADRQLRVRGGGFEMVIDVDRSSDHVDVRGTVFGIDEPCSVQLLDGADEAALSVTDDLGEFVLLGVVPGRYELVVAARRAELSTDLDLS